MRPPAPVPGSAPPEFHDQLPPCSHIAPCRCSAAMGKSKGTKAKGETLSRGNGGSAAQLKHTSPPADDPKQTADTTARGLRGTRSCLPKVEQWAYGWFFDEMVITIKVL